MNLKNIEDIPLDIDRLFAEGKEVNEDNLNQFLSNLGSILRDRLKRNLNKEKQEPTLRISKIGLPNRKLWFEFNTPQEESNSKNVLKFIYGDIIEQLIFFLLKEAGHTVEDEQREVTVEGVLGHQDGKIDGYTADVKSASSFAFRKFLQGTLSQDDPFGYVAQLSAYTKASGNDKAAFIAVNKESGEIAILKLHDIDMIDPEARVREIKEVLKSQEPPKEKCYLPENYGTSGNKVLHKNCNYCIYKFQCWKDANNGLGLRTFKYASGPVHLTEVVNTPKVEEIVQDLQ